ncbi:TIM barrel protein [Candidatus Poribacteria bacterium]|nr:TIM barrel protein [Candidatus Poribacteria bacterium]
MKYGARDGVLRQPWDKLFEEAAKIGFDGVELDLGANYADTMMWSQKGRDHLKKLSERSGVELAAVCLGVMWGTSLANPDPQVQQEAKDIIKSTIMFCKELGAGFILVPITPFRDGDIEPDQAVDNWIEGLKPCASLAEENKVFLAVENVGGGVCPSAKRQMQIIEGVDSPYVQAYYDFGNGLGLGNDPVEEINLLGEEHIAAIHAKAPGGTYLGEGKLDFDAVAEAIKGIGYDGYVILETAATDNPSEAASKNLAYLKKMFE